jgi:hypothetical protein
MATSLPKKEIVVQNRIDDNSFPQIPWKVERKGNNDMGRVPQPCLSCAGATDQGVKGYDEDYELDNKFQMFGGLEGFEGADDGAEADMFLDEDLEPFGVSYVEEEAFEDGDILFEEESAPIESFFPEEYAADVRCPPPPPARECGHCAASPCACEHRHMQRCGLASLALFVALIALAAVLFKKRK